LDPDFVEAVVWIDLEVLEDIPVLLEVGLLDWTLWVVVGLLLKVVVGLAELKVVCTLVL
jgi:hypothetical protein